MSVTFRAKRSVSIPCPEVHVEVDRGLLDAGAGSGSARQFSHQESALTTDSDVVELIPAGGAGGWRDGEDERSGGQVQRETQRLMVLGRSVVPARVRVRVRVEEYLQQVERVVRVCFPDSRRLRFLGGDSWRATLRPVTFFSFSAVPTCTVR